jgi:hypothetical protein
MPAMRWSLLLLASACTHTIDQDIPGSRAGEVVADCVVPLADRGAPTSLEYDADGVSLWIWEDARALIRSAEGACRGEIEPLAGPAVPLLPEEEAENAARTDGRRIAVGPLGGFVAAGQGYLYYEKVLRGPGVFDSQPLGTGVCVLPSRTDPCVRTGQLLWTTARPWGGSGFVDGDGYAYIVSCQHAAAFEDVCGTARVRPGEAADASAYTFLDFDGQFGADPGGAVTVLRDTGIARSDVPGGPFRLATIMFPAVAPESFFIGGGREHRALRVGEVTAVTYDSRPSGLHLVTFRFAPEVWR